MVYVPVQCLHCQSTAVIKAGKQANGTQRYQCQNRRSCTSILRIIPQSENQVVYPRWPPKEGKCQVVYLQLADKSAA
jgi:InsA N-terminal domain